MNRFSTVTVVLVLALCGGALAQEEKPLRTISVSGTVEAKMAPDQILWTISLRDTNTNLREAKARNDQEVKAVLGLREQLGIAEGDLETGYLSISREYERDRFGNRGDFKHFVVSRTVTIRQQDLKRFDEYLDTLVSSADMEVSFSFQSSRIHDVRAETRLKALQTAKDKAAAMAEVVGAKLGRVVTINEHAENTARPDFASNVAFVHSSPPVDVATERFVPGAIDVRVTVYVTFELQ